MSTSNINIGGTVSASIVANNIGTGSNPASPSVNCRNCGAPPTWHKPAVIVVYPDTLPETPSMAFLDAYLKTSRAIASIPDIEIVQPQTYTCEYCGTHQPLTPTSP